MIHIEYHINTFRTTSLLHLLASSSRINPDILQSIRGSTHEKTQQGPISTLGLHNLRAQIKQSSISKCRLTSTRSPQVHIDRLGSFDRSLSNICIYNLIIIISSNV